jgi:2'-5' RNA ligase
MLRMPLRTFLALDIDEHIRRRLLAVRDELRADGKVTWVGPDQLHVTLKFLGDVPDERLGDVCELAAAVAATVPVFEFDIRGVIATPAHGELRMLWAGVADTTGQMSKLRQGLDAALADMGLHEEQRQFRPHITLARIKYLADPRAVRAAVALMRDRDFGMQHALELAAYTSQLTRDGPLYAAVARCPLC